MIYENAILSGSIQISGSLNVNSNDLSNGAVSSSYATTSSFSDITKRVRAGSSGSRPSNYSNIETGSLWYNTNTLALEVFTGVSASWWQPIGSGSSETIQSLSATVDIEYLLVAGGGGGGRYGGGGAGGLLSSSLASVTSGSSFTVTVGTGGTGTYTAQGAQGSDSTIAGSSISTITSVGGGGGGEDDTDLATDGGSGGGTGHSSTNNGSGTVGQGNDGGTAVAAVPNSYSGAGGGGAGSVGGSATTATVAGNGGAGLQSNITGTGSYYAGGGGGATFDNNDTAGTGGVGGGGNGPKYNLQSPINVAGSTGTVNTGGGGGAAYNGGSGVAIFAYSSGSTSSRLAGGIVGDAGNGNKYHQFNTTGTLKVGSAADFQVVTDSLRIHLDAGDFASRGTSTWTDLSGNSHNATMTGTDLDSNYYYTYGSGDYGTITYNSNIQLSLGSSVEIWIKHANTSGGQLPLWMRNVGGICIGNVINANNVGYWTFAKFTTGWVDVKSSTGVDTNWHHLVGVVETSAIKIYVDGALEGTTSNSDAVTTAYTYDQHVGGYQPDTATYSYYGDIGQYRMYNKALSAAEVLQNYEATKTNFV